MCNVMTRSNGIKGRTTDEKFQDRWFLWERGASVGQCFLTFKTFYMSRKLYNTLKEKIKKHYRSSIKCIFKVNRHLHHQVNCVLVTEYLVSSLTKIAFGYFPPLESQQGKKKKKKKKKKKPLSLSTGEQTDVLEDVGWVFHRYQKED